MTTYFGRRVAFHILVEDEQEARDLAMGHVSPNIRKMVSTMLDWELADLRRAAEEEAAIEAKLAKKKRRRKTQAA